MAARVSIVGARPDDAQVVAQPLHQCAGDGDGTFECVTGFLLADLPCDGGDETAGRRHRRLAGVHQQEAAGAVGVLGLARREARLAHKRRLLVAEDSRDRHAISGSEHSGRRHDARQHGAWNAERGEQRRVPIQRREVHQLRAAGVGDVGQVQTGEVPQQPAIDRAEREVAGLRTPARIGHVVEQPAQLQSGKIAGERQAGPRAKPVLAAVARELRHQRIDARVLPDDRVVHRSAGGAVPQQRGLALVGDADRGEVAVRQVRAAQCLGDDRLGVAPDFQRIVFDPAGPRVDLPVLHLRAGDRCARAVEHDEAGARGALVDRADVAFCGVCHGSCHCERSEAISIRLCTTMEIAASLRSSQ